MARLSWGKVGERFYEAGADRGVLFLDDVGVPWNGLTAINENPSGGDPTPYYLDGEKYLNIASAEEFEATIQAFSSPMEFGVCDGTASIANGLFATQQPRRSFGLSYRTRLGNDQSGTDHGYKLHLVYNALARPSSRNHTTIGRSSEPIGFSWAITTLPNRVSGIKPTAHLVIDSTKANSIILGYLEAILYGTEVTNPRLPSIDEVISLFAWDVLDTPYPVTILGTANNTKSSVINMATNPSFETAGTTIQVRKNWCVNPLPATSTGGWARAGSVASTLTLESTGGPQMSGGVWMKNSITGSGTDNLLNWAQVIYPVFASWSGWVMSSRAGTYQIRAWTYDAAGAYLTSANDVLSPDFTLQANVWTWINVPMTQPGTAYSRYMPIFRQSGSAIAWAPGDYMGAALVTFSESYEPKGFPSFTGTRKPALKINAVSNPAFESGVTNVQQTNSSTFARVTTEAHSGTGCLEVTTTGLTGQGISITVASTMPVATLEPVPVSAWIKGPAGLVIQISAQEYTPPSTAVPPASTVDVVMTGDWVRAVVWRTPAAIGNVIRPGIVVLGAHTATKFYVDDVMVELGADGEVGDAFHGASTLPPGFLSAWVGTAHNSPSYLIDGDLGLSWTGTANASTSITTGLEVVGSGTSTTRSTIQSTRWALNGTKSARQIPSNISANTDTYTAPFGDLGAMRGGMIAGKTYTALATLRLTKAQAGSLATIARELAFFYRTTSGGSTYFQVRPAIKPANAAGIYPQRVVATLPADTIEAFVRLYNGTSPGNGDSWWDSIMLVEGTYDGPYVDGAVGPTTYKYQSQTPVWVGTADASTTLLEYYDALTTPKTVGDAYIVDDDLWVFTTGGYWENYGPVPTL